MPEEKKQATTPFEIACGIVQTAQTAHLLIAQELGTEQKRKPRPGGHVADLNRMAKLVAALRDAGEAVVVSMQVADTWRTAPQAAPIATPIPTPTEAPKPVLRAVPDESPAELSGAMQ